MSGRGVDAKFTIAADDDRLIGDGADATRVVMRVTDEFGAIRPFADDSIKLVVEGPAEIIGDNPFSLVGGTGAVWIRTKEQAGTVRLTATHPRLGPQELQFQISEAPVEI
jgi:beta-galactosidase